MASPAGKPCDPSIAHRPCSLLFRVVGYRYLHDDFRDESRSAFSYRMSLYDPQITARIDFEEMTEFCWPQTRYFCWDQRIWIR